MQRRTILNLALGALVAAIAALLWLVPPEEKAAAPVLVPGADPARIDAIRVQRADLPELRFRRNGGTWMMTAPVAAPAHDARINALLGLLADQSLSTLPATDLARFGLAEPAVVVEIGPHRIALGDSHPIDAQRYVLYGETVHLVPDSLYPQLVQNAGFFLDSRLLPPAVRPIRIRYPAFTLESGTDGWHEIPPGSRDATALSSAVDGWKSSRALAVRAPAGTAETLGTIAIESDDGTGIEFEIRSLEPAPVLARRDLDVQYHLDALTGSQLLLGPSPAPPAE